MMRVPPHSMDLERALIASAFCDQSVIDVCEGVKPETFYADAHSGIWQAILGAKARGLGVDMSSVRDELVRTARLPSVGGDEALFAITASIGAPDVEVCARELLDLAQRRRVLTVCMEAVARGYDRSYDTRPYLEWVQSTVFQAAIAGSSRGGLERMSAVGTLQRIEDVNRGIVSPKGYSTSLDALDTQINGLEPGGLYIIAGRPGMGKTSLALGAYHAVTKSLTHCAAFFSLEMRKQKIIDRYISIASGIPARALRDGVLTEEHRNRIERISVHVAQAKDYIEDTPAMTLDMMRASLRRMLAKEDKPLGLIVIDHIGLARASKATFSREQEVSDIARDAKTLAKEFDAPVVGLCQLNRKCEERPDKRPKLSDLRDSGEVEQSADAVLLLYRQGYYAAEMKAGRAQETRMKSTIEAGDDDGKAEIIRAKVRDDEPGTTHVLWEGECTRFVDYGHNDYRPDARMRGYEEE